MAIAAVIPAALAIPVAPVIPANAGIHSWPGARAVDPGVRRDDW